MSTPSKTLPAPLMRAFSQFQRQRYTLQLAFQDYCTLYGHSPERVELLNRSAGAFFAHHQTILFEYLVLGITRLLDPATTSQQTNLVLEYFVVQFEKLGDRRLAEALRKHVRTLSTRCRMLVSRRHKTLAHNDLETKLGIRQAEPIARADLRAALELLHAFEDEITTVYFDGPVALEVIEPLGAVGSLLDRLSEADQARELRRRR